MRRLAIATLVLAAVASAARADDDAAVRYMAVFMNDAKVGYQRSARRV